MLGWLLHEQGIEPHVTVFDKSARHDGTFSPKPRRTRAKSAVGILSLTY
jgi:hypothetical protein